MQPVAGRNQARFFRGTQTYHGSGGDRSAPLRGFFEPICGREFRGLWARICWFTYESSYGQEGEPGLGQFFDEPWPPENLNDFEWIYGYEGVLVPGGSLVVGHWWDVQAASHALQTGPFIFWCI